MWAIPALLPNSTNSGNHPIGNSEVDIVTVSKIQVGLAKRGSKPSYQNIALNTNTRLQKDYAIVTRSSFGVLRTPEN